jgi:23S rRNA pseudouridine2457 synthase
MANLILLNKPFQVLSQFSDDNGRATLKDFVKIKGFYPAGRLDYDSEGLIILTDDGQTQHQLANPAFKLEKTYWVQVEGEIDQAALDKLAKGVTLKDGLTKPAKAKAIKDPQLWARNPPIRERQNLPTSWLELKIKEGKNRQVRRMTAAVGYPTLRLIRYAIGNWTVAGLQVGKYKQEVVHLSLPAKSNKAKKPFSKNTRKTNTSTERTTRFKSKQR